MRLDLTPEERRLVAGMCREDSLVTWVGYFVTMLAPAFAFEYFGLMTGSAAAFVTGFFCVLLVLFWRIGEQFRSQHTYAQLFRKVEALAIEELKTAAKETKPASAPSGS
jgi:hypothetical protein